MHLKSVSMLYKNGFYAVFLLDVDKDYIQVSIKKPGFPGFSVPIMVGVNHMDYMPGTVSGVSSCSAACSALSSLERSRMPIKAITSSGRSRVNTCA